MKITSEKAYVAATNIAVFEFLSVPANIEFLLPKDKISDFQVHENGCSFRVQGGILIPLEYTGKHEFNKIELKSGEKAPFSYTLTIHLTDLTHVCEGHIEFHADINLFMKMMVEKPLVSLFNLMATKLQDQFNNENESL
jgi:hypothetical protein